MALQKKTVVVLLIVVAAMLAVVKFIMKPFQSTTQEPKIDVYESLDDHGHDEILEEEGLPSEVMLEQSSSTPADTTEINTSYKTPGGSDTVGFKITVDGAGVITGAETNILAKNPTSIKRQQSFADALPGVVVGKKLSELRDIDRVGGSSLTTNAFNEALPALQAQL